MATIQIRPQPTGFVAVTTHGTPVQLITPGLAGGSLGLAEPWGVASGVNGTLPGGDAFARRIDFKAPAGGAEGHNNVGRVFIGLKTMNKTTYAGVIWYLDPGEAYTLENSQQPLPYHMADYWIDSDNDGDGIICTFDPS